MKLIELLHQLIKCFEAKSKLYYNFKSTFEIDSKLRDIFIDNQIINIKRMSSYGNALS